jgi:hypothetical protein
VKENLVFPSHVTKLCEDSVLFAGIVEETTCGDIVKALLSAEGRLRSGEEHVDKFVLVERWRKGMPNQTNPNQTHQNNPNQLKKISTKTNQINQNKPNQPKQTKPT